MNVLSPTINAPTMVSPIQRTKEWLGWPLVVVAVVLIPFLSACDFDVTNPGPIEDNFLDNPGAWESIVNGVELDLSHALDHVAYRQSAICREVHPSGSTFSWGLPPSSHVGLLPDNETSVKWDNAQQARWTADHAVERLEGAMDPDEFENSELVAQAYLLQGYAYRLLGENMCQTVINGSGILGDNTLYLEHGGLDIEGDIHEHHAMGAFASAEQVARAAGNQEMELAAVAGQASVLKNLDRWEEAKNLAEDVLADGGRDFEYALEYSTQQSDQHNRIYWAQASEPYRAHSTWETFYEDYYQQYEDPRVAWDFVETEQGVEWTDIDGNTRTVRPGDASVAGLGTVPHLFNLKHDTRTAPIRLSSGHEMELIRAEAMIREDGEWEAAIDLINDMRRDVGVDEWEAPDSMDEAWALLIRERGIELWLEARRLNDFRRWTEGEPGADPQYFGDYEWDGGSLEMREIPERDLCFPIPQSEQDANPNI